MTINSVLFNSYLREPALLQVGSAQNYQSLADYLASEEETSSAATAITDQVNLALDKVAGKMVTEVAALTAEVIGDNPEFQNDYVLAIIDDGTTREARVYSRADILAAFEGTEEEKAKLEQSLAENPLLTYTSAAILPPSSDSEAAQSLSEKVNSFLTANKKLLDMLKSYGYDPFSVTES
ncbi:MAG: hypothetical protein LBS60_14780 [Deltaproteobacteria bacterium]|jgi:hypothetical protein|nr:hypothetical protein [Deltaproteobacteria bacterium]